jgi:hypothetical protein
VKALEGLVLQLDKDIQAHCVSSFGKIALAIIALVGLHSARPHPVETAAPSSGGEWEGLIAFTRAPWVLHINFDSKTAGVDQWGATAFPMQNLRLEKSRVSFAVSSNSDRLSFDGKIETFDLVGDVLRSDGSMATVSLHRLPRLPKPSTREEAWQQDIDAALNRFLLYDRSFSTTARDEFRSALRTLHGSLPRMSDEQVIVRLSQAVALSHNAHTRLYLLRMQTVLRRYPIRVWWFTDGLYVVKTTAPYRKALGCRLLAIGDHDVQTVRARVSSLFSGNKSWAEYMSVYYMTSPEILYGLGLIQDMERAQFRFDNCKAGRLAFTVKPLPLRKSTKAVEAWWDLSPKHRSDAAEFLHALRNIHAVPLYLRHPDEYYWFEYLPTENAVYFQYNKSLDLPGGAPFTKFSANLLKFIDQHHPRHLVLDLRFNTGGDLNIASPLMEALHERMRDKPVFVITGRATFSAGLYHAARWKQWGAAVFVGEPPGDNLDFWAEGGDLVLPNSHLALRYSNGFHKYSAADYPNLKPYFMQLNVSSMEPNVPIRCSARDYLAGRDRVMAYVLSASSQATHRLTSADRLKIPVMPFKKETHESGGAE